MQRAVQKLGIHLVQSPFLVAKQAAENPLFSREINRAITTAHNEESSYVQKGDAGLLYSSGSAGQLRHFASFSNATSAASHLSCQAYAIHKDWVHTSRQHDGFSGVPYWSSGALLVEQQPQNLLRNPAYNLNETAPPLASQPVVSPFSIPKTQPLLALYRDYVRGRATASPAASAGPQQQRGQGWLSSPFSSTPQAVLQQQQQQQQVEQQLRTSDATRGQTVIQAAAPHTALYGQHAAGAPASAPAAQQPSVGQGYQLYHHQYSTQRGGGSRVGKVEKKKKVHSSTRTRERLADLTAKHEQLCQQYEQLITTNRQLTQQYCRLSAELDASLPQLLQLQAQLEPSRTACTASDAASDTSNSIPQVLPSTTANITLHLDTDNGSANTHRTSRSGLLQLHPTSLQMLLPPDSVAAGALETDEDFSLRRITQAWSSLVDRLADLLPELDSVPADHVLRQPGVSHQQQEQQQQQRPQQQLEVAPFSLQQQQEHHAPGLAVGPLAAAAATLAATSRAASLSPAESDGAAGGPFAAVAATGWNLEAVHCCSTQSLSMLVATPTTEAQATEVPLTSQYPKRCRPLHSGYTGCDELISLMSSTLSLSLDAPLPKHMRLDTDMFDSFGFGSEELQQTNGATAAADATKPNTDFAAAEESAAVLPMKAPAEGSAAGKAAGASSQGGQSSSSLGLVPPAALQAAAVYQELLALTRQLFCAGPRVVYRLLAEPSSALKPAAGAADASSSLELYARHGSSADVAGTTLQHWQGIVQQTKLTHEQRTALRQLQSELTCCHEEANSLRRQSVLAFQDRAGLGGCIAAAATAESGMAKWDAAWTAVENIQDSFDRDYQLLEQALNRLWGMQSELSFIQKLHCLTAGRPCIPGYDFLDALQL